MKLHTYKSLFSECTRIGKGGQKIVYRVQNADGVFALKIVSAPDNPRVLQEIDILRSLNVPNVPRILDTGILEDDISNDPLLFILEEFVDGESLRDIIKIHGTVSTTIGCLILESLLNIEIMLEERTILHRDIKPDNVMLAPDGRVFLIDFGIAKIMGNPSLTKTILPNGPCTPAYAPRELATNMKQLQDVRTDLYQIGLTVYEAVSGLNPFSDGARSAQEVFMRGNTITVPTIQIQGDTKGLLMQYLLILMARNQSQRPKTARDAKRYYDAIRPTIDLGGIV